MEIGGIDMITKCYEVYCDGCKSIIGYYIDRKPSLKKLREDGVVVKGDRHFCNGECLRRYLERDGK